MTTGPDQPEVPVQEGEKAVRITGYNILSCPDCKRDCLFALVDELPSLQQFQFCSNCGRYFEKGGEPDDEC